MRGRKHLSVSGKISYDDIILIVLPFLTNRSTGASHFAAYWIADSAPGLWLNLVGCFLFTVPLYCLAGLRSGWGKNSFLV